MKKYRILVIFLLGPSLAFSAAAQQNTGAVI
jgi:hypothetical protein